MNKWKIWKGRACVLREYPFNSIKINVVHVSNDSARVIINSAPTKVILWNCVEGLKNVGVRNSLSSQFMLSTQLIKPKKGKLSITRLSWNPRSSWQRETSFFSEAICVTINCNEIKANVYGQKPIWFHSPSYEDDKSHKQALDTRNRNKIERFEERWEKYTNITWHHVGEVEMFSHSFFSFFAVFPFSSDFLNFKEHTLPRGTSLSLKSPPSPKRKRSVIVRHVNVVPLVLTDERTFPLV